MQYLGFKFIISNTEDFQKDLLIDDLAQIGFDSFEDQQDGFVGYIPEENFEENGFINVQHNYSKEWLTEITKIEIENKNWNEEWEKNFSPILVADQCYVRAQFHPERNEFPYQIVIDPKMSFGTGHHQTTSTVMELMLTLNFEQKHVLDMGCGTGILAILASQLGAKYITAIDYDDICVESTLENIKINRTENITALKGSKEAIPSTEIYDIVIANINRNILLDQIESYYLHLKNKGLLIMSGFYIETDLEIIENHCHKFGLKKINHKVKEQWTAAIFEKI